MFSSEKMDRESQCFYASLEGEISPPPQTQMFSTADDETCGPPLSSHQEGRGGGGEEVSVSGWVASFAEASNLRRRDAMAADLTSL